MKIGVAISTFQKDDLVIRLLTRIKGEAWPVDEIIVVDSLGTGRIPSFINSQNWSNVFYYNFPTNIGAAGNLRERLRIALERGWKFALALNDDALLGKNTLLSMLKHTQKDKLGALYPLKYFPARSEYDLSGTREVGPWRATCVKSPPSSPLIPVKWSSSNGALYSTLPTKNSVLPHIGTWFGWEDYHYGLDLKQRGYDQFIVTESPCDDNYEYEERRLAGVKVIMSNKPAWYQYYRIRNLCLIHFHYHPSFIRIIWAISRTALEGIAIGLGWAKKNKLLSLQYLCIGFYHGLIRREGKWRLP